MRGLVFSGDKQVDLLDFPDPTPGPGEVVLEMKASGICGTDLHFFRAPKGTTRGVPGTDQAIDGSRIIGGHEPCGVVAAVGEGVSERQAKVGDRVMVHHYWACGTCDACRSGWTQMCQVVPPVAYGATANGGHAPYLLVPAGTLVALPDELSFETGAAISCGTGTSYAALRRIGLTGGDTIVVSGQGPVGLAGTQLAAAMGARVIAVDPSEERRSLAQKLGAAEVVDSGSDVVAAVKELTGGRGADKVLEASGVEPARQASIQVVRPWGTVGFVGAGPNSSVDLARIMPAQITVIGSWTFSTIGQGECARFIAERGVAADDVFTDRWTLEQGAEAYKAVDEQGAGKGVFVL